MRTSSLASTAALVAALAAPVLVAGAQTTQPAQTTQSAQTVQPVTPKHHSVLKGALVGGVAGSAVPGHRHPILGAVAGAEVQHHRNKAAKRAYKQAQQQQVTPTTP